MYAGHFFRGHGSFPSTLKAGGATAPLVTPLCIPHYTLYCTIQTLYKYVNIPQFAIRENEFI